MNKRQKKRLLNVAKALYESPNPDMFDMEQFGHYGCGTPACALGHYAFRGDLQKLLTLNTNGDLRLRRAPSIYRSGWSSWEKAREHFGLTEDEMDELFSEGGCDEARTPIEAAKYIENFVEKRS